MQNEATTPTAKAVRRKRRCGQCGHWYVPDPRVGRRQRTCGSPACRRRRKQRTQRQWTKRNPEYWAERRLRDQIERLEKLRAAGKSVKLHAPPRELSAVPVALAQAEIAPEVLVFFVFFSRLAHRAAQAEIRAQVLGMKAEMARLGAAGRQVETDAGHGAT
jgi:hypothetical protein